MLLFLRQDVASLRFQNTSHRSRFFLGTLLQLLFCDLLKFLPLQLQERMQLAYVASHGFPQLLRRQWVDGWSELF